MLELLRHAADRMIHADHAGGRDCGPQSSADRLRVEILSASRGGALPLTVDLTGVTHLASVGVRLLHQLVRSASADLRMLAAVGTPADQILTLTGLEHIDKR
jgi:anti-anti-sigma regulatory factor